MSDILCQNVAFCKFLNDSRSQLGIAYNRVQTWRTKTGNRVNRVLNSDKSHSIPDSSSCVPVLPLASMNEYVNIKRQFVSHPPISVQARALHFSLGEKIISGSRAAIFSPNVEQRRALRFTTLGPINDRLQTSVAFSRCGRLWGYPIIVSILFHTSNRFSIIGKFPWTWDLLHGVVRSIL